ncbi:hypothetical protein W02_16050 [Nitrospira sp. KM1]|uniref:class I SAM-dependent methyltransferase n=1 Tax=Nitrospira sp. KM1 TaxID=1936990 RepID=UPI0013A74D81|nr:class I SAM-dependent methyltransferase [Nitrospira sp. KM1]BCA54465.1 hypothetical protein W02_16050 [Nitrospira sp. KM1]
MEGSSVVVQDNPDQACHQQKSNKAFGSDRVAQSVWYRSYDLRYEADLISRCFLSGSRVLDLGCGYGRTTVSLKRLGYEVIGTDVVERMIEEARSAHPDMDYRIMDACAIAFPDSSFDHVLFSFNGIDCILPESRRLTAMREIFRVLKPGGTALLSSHNWLPYLLIPSHLKNGKWLSWFRQGVLSRRWYSAGVEDLPFDCYISTPWRTLRQLREVGFEQVRIASGQRPLPRFLQRATLLTLCVDLWPHFIAKKHGSGITEAAHR